MKLFKRNKKQLSIDFGSSDLKLVEGQVSNGSINIFKSTSIPLELGMYDNGKISNISALSRVIMDLIRNHKINKDLHGVAVINSTSIITREISIPKVEVNEVDSLISYQISEFLPINPDDYVVDHLPLESLEVDDMEKMRILLIAIPKEMVLNHLQLMDDSGLNPQILDFQGNAIAKLLDFNSTLNGNYSLKDKTITFIDIGFKNTDVILTKAGRVEVTRTFDVGAHTIYKSIQGVLDLSLEEAEDKIKAIEDLNESSEEFDDYNRILNLTRTSIQELINEIQSVIRYYTSRSIDNSVDLLLLHGEIASLNGICQMFKDNLDIDTVKLQSLDRVKFNGDLSLYANAIGGLIRKDGVKK